MSKASRYFWIISTVMLVAALVCLLRDPHETVQVTDLSTVVTFERDGSNDERVVGLDIGVLVHSTHSVRFGIGCNGKVVLEVEVPNNAQWHRRLDWYDDCAEIWFVQNGDTAAAITLKYRFIVL